MTEDEMVGWHHRLKGHEFESGSLSCGAREVRFLCAWLGGARHCSRVMVGVQGDPLEKGMATQPVSSSGEPHGRRTKSMGSHSWPS